MPYAGTTITLRVRGVSGRTRKVIYDAECTVELYAPPKNPQANPADRMPDYVFPAEFDPVSRYYVAHVPTEGWAPGTWWMRGVLTGGEEGHRAFEYSSFPLQP